MIQGSISLEARTDLVIIERGGVAALRYIIDYLEDHVGPYAAFLGPDFIFMHDNARPHIAKKTQSGFVHQNYK